MVWCPFSNSEACGGVWVDSWERAGWDGRNEGGVGRGLLTKFLLPLLLPLSLQEPKYLVSLP